MTKVFRLGGEMVEESTTRNIMQLIAEGTGGEDDDEG